MFLLLALGNVVTVTTYMIDHTAAARRFDGIGALSGGGTTSKLLPDYHSELVTSTSNFKRIVFIQVFILAASSAVFVCVPIEDDYPYTAIFLRKEPLLCYAGAHVGHGILTAFFPRPFQHCG